MMFQIHLCRALGTYPGQIESQDLGSTGIGTNLESVILMRAKIDKLILNGIISIEIG